MPSVNDTLGGKYVIVRRLGVGGMGEVFEALNTNTGRRVAIKTLHAHQAADPDLVTRFLQEARAATRVQHPHVIDVLDLEVDPASNVPYIVQEFLVGETLQDHLQRRHDGRVPPREAITLLLPVIDALVEAHRVNITHRDLKPANIFLTRDRNDAVFPKLIDFGIAKVRAEADAGLVDQTRAGVAMGTPSYMAPEQAGGDASLDARADVWSMGVVLYEALSGHLPHEASNTNRVIGMIQYEDPTPINARVNDLPPSVVALVMGALRRDRDERYASMRVFYEAARACLASLPADGSVVRLSDSSSSIPRDAAHPQPRSRGRVAIAAAVAVLALAGGLGGIWWLRGGEPTTGVDAGAAPNAARALPDAAGVAAYVADAQTPATDVSAVTPPDAPAPARDANEAPDAGVRALRDAGRRTHVPPSGRIRLNAITDYP